ncbi:hypothetical protein B0H13DRAFT_1850304 [Mycena leptocephala]|nr:hypothetical protein B0H13DRAFT_1850304 [Mycena leptocephala]
MSCSSTPPTNADLYVRRRRAHIACTIVGGGKSRWDFQCQRCYKAHKSRVSVSNCPTTTTTGRAQCVRRKASCANTPVLKDSHPGMPPSEPDSSDPWRTRLVVIQTSEVISPPSPPPPPPQPIKLPSVGINDYRGPNPGPSPTPRDTWAHQPWAPPQNSLSGYPQAGPMQVQHHLGVAAPQYYPGAAPYLPPPTARQPSGILHDQNHSPLDLPHAKPGGTLSQWPPAM